jgi:hypothetical protein
MLLLLDRQIDPKFLIVLIQVLRIIFEIFDIFPKAD